MRGASQEVRKHSSHNKQQQNKRVGADREKAEARGKEERREREARQ